LEGGDGRIVTERDSNVIGRGAAVLSMPTEGESGMGIGT
jgi:hypothetical protein